MSWRIFMMKEIFSYLQIWPLVCHVKDGQICCYDVFSFLPRQSLKLTPWLLRATVVIAFPAEEIAINLFGAYCSFMIHCSYDVLDRSHLISLPLSLSHLIFYVRIFLNLL